MNAEERQALHDAIVDACSGLDSRLARPDLEGA